MNLLIKCSITKYAYVRVLSDFFLKTLHGTFVLQVGLLMMHSVDYFDINNKPIIIINIEYYV